MTFRRSFVSSSVKTEVQQYTAESRSGHLLKEKTRDVGRVSINLAVSVSISRGRRPRLRPTPWRHADWRRAAPQLRNGCRRATAIAVRPWAWGPSSWLRRRNSAVVGVCQLLRTDGLFSLPPRGKKDADRASVFIILRHNVDYHVTPRYRL